MKTTITFDRAYSQLVIDALEADNCSHCGVELKPGNFAGAYAGKFYCKALPCLLSMPALDEED